MSEVAFDLLDALHCECGTFLVSGSRGESIMLLICPFCDSDVIEGTDSCDACGQPIMESGLPPPANTVERALLSDRVSLFQGRQPLTVSPQTTVKEVLRLLADNRVGCLLVQENGKSIGIFTERDVLLKIGDKAEEMGSRPISEFMTSKVESLPPTAKIAFAVQRMDHGGYRHVPVVNDQGQTVGIFSVRDILGYLTNKLSMSK